MGYAARVGEKEMRTRFLSGYMKGGDHFGNLNVETEIVLKRYSKKYGVRVKIGLVWFRISSMDALL
jgi:hypothetical protein